MVLFRKGFNSVEGLKTGPPRAHEAPILFLDDYPSSPSAK